MNEKGVEVTAPTEIGTYTSWQLTKSGLAKLAARTNYLFTIVQTSDVYTIKQISGAVELSGSKTYDGKAGVPSIHVKLAEVSLVRLLQYKWHLAVWITQQMHNQQKIWLMLAAIQLN